MTISRAEFIQRTDSPCPAAWLRSACAGVVAICLLLSGAAFVVADGGDASGKTAKPEASKKSDPKSEARAAEKSGEKPVVKPAEKPGAKPAAKPTEKSPTKSTAKSPEPLLDEKSALKFATEHHPELADLLQALRKSDKTQYQAALSDVARDSERLAKLSDRDQDRYGLALTIWKLDSRIRLEMARFAMSEDPEREARIRELLKQRHEARRSLLQLDRKRMDARAAKIDEQLAALGGDSKERATAEFERLKKSVAGKGRTKSQKPEPAATKAATATKDTGAKDAAPVKKPASAKDGSGKNPANTPTEAKKPQ